MSQIELLIFFRCNDSEFMFIKNSTLSFVDDTLTLTNKICLGFASMMGRGNIHGVGLVTLITVDSQQITGRQWFILLLSLLLHL